MSQFQQTPIFADVARWQRYAAKGSATQTYVSITVAGGNNTGTITLKPQVYFVCTAMTAWTNYDDVAPVAKTANSVATLGKPFVPCNFTVEIKRESYNNYSNRPITQAEICSNGYRAGKVFPLPVVYSPRSNFQFKFQDLTGLFLLTATSEGTAVPMRIYLSLVGYDVPIDKWDKFCRIFPQFAAAGFGSPS